MDTPWGKAQSFTNVADGIVAVSTASHGGYHVFDGALAVIKKRFPGYVPFAGEGWYEEDCDWAIVELCFPEHFPPEAQNHARKTLEYMAKRGGISGSNWQIIADNIKEVAA